VDKNLFSKWKIRIDGMAFCSELYTVDWKEPRSLSEAVDAALTLYPVSRWEVWCGNEKFSNFKHIPKAA